MCAAAVPVQQRSHLAFVFVSHLTFTFRAIHKIYVCMAQRIGRMCCTPFYVCNYDLVFIRLEKVNLFLFYHSICKTI